MRRPTAAGGQAGAALPVHHLPLARTMAVVAAGSVAFAAWFGINGLAGDLAAGRLLGVGFLVLAGLAFASHRLLDARRVQDGATVAAGVFLGGALMLAVVLPGSAVVTTLGCMVVLTLALQHLGERRLLAVLTACGVTIVAIVVSRQSWRTAPDPQDVRDVPLWVLDSAELAGAATMAAIVAVLLLQFRRRLEGTIVELRGHLERERSLQDEKARETRARAVAEEQGRARAEFLAHMSHEIRTPLNAVIGLAGLLEDAELDERAAEHARIIRASGDHLLTIVNDILDFSQIDAGALVIGADEVRPGPLVEDVADVLQVEAQRRGITLTASVAPEVPGSVIADEARLRQILMNLVANAVRFTDDGSVTVAVSTRADRLLFVVTDTGVGIRPERLAAIFEPFTQAEAFAAHHRGGTGLGLSISRELADRMDGRLSADSRPGYGSTFTLDLPLRPTGTAASAIARPSLDPGMAARRPRRILVVEDSRTNQLVVVRILERLGYRADVAADGAEALQALERQTYDVVLMDIHMPTMDGYDATRAIRGRWKPERQPHIIAFTAAAFEADRAACFAAGMDDFLTKPATGPALVAALERAPRMEERRRG